jgi:S-formylglutathione hydrolase FrmB
VFPGSPRVRQITAGGTKANVLLPVGYDTSTRRYPVLYLVHGATINQDSWLDHTDVEHFTSSFTDYRATIVVMPDAGFLGIQADGRDDEPQRGSVFFSTLISYVDANFRTLADRSHRAVTGMSAGAVTAMLTAARHPDWFAAVGSLSGAPDLMPASPAGDSVFFLGSLAVSIGQYHDPVTDFGLGDPVRDDIWLHSANPASVVVNFRGMTVYLAAGNGLPCDATDVDNAAVDPITNGPNYTLQLIEPGANGLTRSFDTKATQAQVAHRTDLFACGIHDWPLFQRELHLFWPQMVTAFATAPPTSFDYQRANPKFSVWDWSFTADPGRAAEFLDITHTSATGITLTGSGLETVTTAPNFTPGHTVALSDGRHIVADPAGRITFTVDLGPAHHLQQYTAQQRAAEAAAHGCYFTTRSLTWTPA